MLPLTCRQRRRRNGRCGCGIEIEGIVRMRFGSRIGLPLRVRMGEVEPRALEEGRHRKAKSTEDRCLALEPDFRPHDTDVHGPLGRR